MAKIGRAPGLVRVDSRRGFAGGVRRFLRGRVVLYAALLLAGITAFGLATTRRRPFEANLLRVPGSAYVLEGQQVRNTFDLQLINKRPGTRTFTIDVVGPEGAETNIAVREVELESLGTKRIAVQVLVPAAAFRAGMRSELSVKCSEADGDLVRITSAPLLGPGPGARR